MGRCRSRRRSRGKSGIHVSGLQAVALRTLGGDHLRSSAISMRNGAARQCLAEVSCADSIRAGNLYRLCRVSSVISTATPPCQMYLTHEGNMRKTALKLTISLLILGLPTLVQAKCLRTVDQLRASDVKSVWRETTAKDGKPLNISIINGPSGLVYSARKAGVLWMTGSVSVCLSGGATEITLQDTKSTNNVPSFARMALSSTQKAQIVNDQIKLGGGGWAGTFAGQ